MDLRLYLRVMWRFRILVGLGLVLAVTLAFLSFVSVSFAGGKPNFSYRQSESWQSKTTYVLTGPGYDTFSINGAKSPLDLTQFSSLYARLATSDEVQRRLARSGPVKGVMEAQTEFQVIGFSKNPTPFISIIGTAVTASSAIDIARRGGQTFRNYVADRQAASGIPPQRRIQLRLVNAALGAVLLEARKKTLPIVIFLTVMTAVIGLAFVLENLRPRIHAVGDLSEDERDRSTRRSA